MTASARGGETQGHDRGERGVARGAAPGDGAAALADLLRCGRAAAGAGGGAGGGAGARDDGGRIAGRGLDAGGRGAGGEPEALEILRARERLARILQDALALGEEAAGGEGRGERVRDGLAEGGGLDGREDELGEVL